MKQTTIFITYNPKVGTEQTLAARLHTIGAVNGFRMYMPDRFNSDSVLDTETRRRIAMSDYLVLFSMSALSPIVKQEIEYAFEHLQDKSKIIVIYDSRVGKNLTGDITEHFTQFSFDPTVGNPDVILGEILHRIFHTEAVSTQHEVRGQQADIQRVQKDMEQAQKAIAALLGIGLGLFTLGALAQENY